MTTARRFPKVSDNVDPQLDAALKGKLRSFWNEPARDADLADDGRKLLEAGVQPTGRGWCSLFAAGVVSVSVLLAAAGVIVKVLL